MSFDAINWAYSVTQPHDLSQSEINVLVAIANFADQSGRAGCYRDTIAARCNLKVDSVSRITAKLAKKGLLRKEVNACTSFPAKRKEGETVGAEIEIRGLRPNVYWLAVGGDLFEGDRVGPQANPVIHRGASQANPGLDDGPTLGWMTVQPEQEINKTITKTTMSKAEASDEEDPNAKQINLLCEGLAKRVGKALEKKPPTVSKAWKKDMSALMRLGTAGGEPEPIDFETIKETIIWIFGPGADIGFVVLSPKALRVKWDNIQINRKRVSGSSAKTTSLEEMADIHLMANELRAARTGNPSPQTPQLALSTEGITQ